LSIVVFFLFACRAVVITENFNAVKVCCETVVTCVEPEKCHFSDFSKFIFAPLAGLEIQVTQIFQLFFCNSVFFVC
jgi:hypothetical protein